MGGYRNPNPARMAGQMERHFDFAGQSATWRHWVSATSGNPIVGQGAVNHYAERTITALFGKLEQMEIATPAGMLAAAMIQVTTKEQLARQDELLWRGETYNVESDPMPARFGAGWITMLQRAST